MNLKCLDKYKRFASQRVQTHLWIDEQLRKIGVDTDAVDIEVSHWVNTKQFIRLNDKPLLAYDYSTGKAWEPNEGNPEKEDYDPRKAEGDPNAFSDYLRRVLSRWEHRNGSLQND